LHKLDGGEYTTARYNWKIKGTMLPVFVSESTLKKFLPKTISKPIIKIKIDPSKANK
jgi:hypothetical protein